MAVGTDQNLRRSETFALRLTWIPSCQRRLDGHGRVVCLSDWESKSQRRWAAVSDTITYKNGIPNSWLLSLILLSFSSCPNLLPSELPPEHSVRCFAWLNFPHTP